MIRRLVLLAAVLTLAGATSASAAPTWLAPRDVSPPVDGDIEPGDVGIDDAGNVIAVWTQVDGPPCGFCASKVRAAFRPAGGSFGVKQQLSPDTNDAFNARLAVNGRGDIVVVWQEFNGANTLVRYSVRPAGGDFTAAQDLSGTGADTSGEPDVAISPDGTAIAVWSRFDGSNWRIQAAVKQPGTTFFGSAGELSAPNVNSGEARVAMDAAGGAVVGWRHGAVDLFDANSSGIRAAARPPGGSFTPLAPVFDEANPGDHIDSVRIAVAPGGQATLVWTLGDSALGERHRVQSSARGTSGNFGPIEDAVSDIDKNSGGSGYLDVAVDADDNAVAAWRSSIVEGAVRSSKASFQDPVPISGPGTAGADPSIAFDGAGTALVAFRGFSGDTPVVQAASHPRNGQFSAVKDIEAEPPSGSFASQTRLAMNPSGDAILTYGLDNAGQRSVRLAGYDGAPPSLLAPLNVPATGSAGVPIAMSASAADVWSAFDIAWDFGDGGVGAGASVSHAYAVPGTYTVALRLTDAVGNVSTAARQIQVAPLVTDADGDGSPSNVDCNDNNPGIRPGAFDRPGDGIDQDCADGDAKRTVTAEMTWGVSPGKRATKFTNLVVTKLQPGARVFVSCAGKGCPFKKRRRVAVKRNAKTVTLTKVFNPKRKGRPRRVAKLRVGTKVIVAVTAPDQIGRLFTLTMRKGRGPRLAKACLAVGSPTQQTSCT